MQWAAAALASAAIALLLDTAAARHHHRSGNGHKPTGDISLWIDQQQIKMFSGKLLYVYRYYRATNIHLYSVMYSFFVFIFFLFLYTVFYLIFNLKYLKLLYIFFKELILFNII